MKYRWSGRALVMAAALAGCASDEFPLPRADAQAAAPLAQAGTGSTYVVGTAVTLDSAGSHAADGASVQVYWTLVTKPAGSTTTIANQQGAMTTCVLDVPGDFVFTLLVTDAAGLRDTSDVTFRATAHALDVAVTTSQPVEWRKPVALHAAIVAQDSVPTTVQWSLVTPDGSAAVITDASSIDATFVPDLEGTYVATTTVTGPDSTQVSSLSLPVAAHYVPLPFAVSAAAWSRAVGRAIIVDQEPGSDLHIVDPATGADLPVPLTDAKGRPVVSLDGHRVAIHDGPDLAIIDLDTHAVIARYPVPPETLDYAFVGAQRLAFWGTAPVSTIELTTGVVTPGLTTATGFGTVTADSHSLYIDTFNGLISHFDVQTATPTFVDDTSAASIVASLRDNTLLLSNGRVARSTAAAATDLMTVGQIASVGQILAATQSPTSGDLITSWIPEANGAATPYLSRYRESTLVRFEHFPLPVSPTSTPGFTSPTDPLVIGVTSDGSVAYVLGYSRHSIPTLYGIFTVPL